MNFISIPLQMITRKMSRRSRARQKQRFRSPVGRDNLRYPIASLLPRRTIRRPDPVRIYGHDDRLFNPLPRAYRPAVDLGGRVALTRIQKRAPLRRAKLEFVLPKKTLVCVRRGVRKEVLFAKKLHGKNGGRKYRRTRNSDIRC